MKPVAHRGSAAQADIERSLEMQAQSHIVLTGATGFIGRRLLSWLGSQSSVTTVDLKRWSADQRGGRDARPSETGRILGNLRDATFIHLAWCPPVRDAFHPHADQVTLLCRFLEEHGESIGRVVAAGSAEEYGSRGGHLRESDSAQEGLSPYGWGKRAAQILLETWSRTHGKPACWLRPFLVYGESQEGNMAIPYALRQARHRQPAAFSAGTQQRDFIHVDDVARGIGLAAKASWQGFRIVNLGTGIGTPVRTVLQRIAHDFGVEELFEFGVKPMRLGEPDVQLAATDVARDLLGFEARIPLEEGLRRLIVAHRNYGNA